MEKKKIAHYNVNIEIISALIMILFSFFARRWTKQLSRDYDEKVVSPSDYTLFFRLDPEQNTRFNKHFYDPSNKKSSRGQQMRAWIWHQLAVFNKDDRIKIARMDLVFNNYAMIQRLCERGKAIKES